MSTPPTRYRNGELAAERFGSLASDYADALTKTDELAAPALDALDAMGERGDQVLEDALTSGLDTVADAPAELKTLLSELESPPFEVDLALIDRGARTLGRCGFLYSMATKQSLYWGYASGAAVKPLAWTGELRKPEVALRRLAETAGWTLGVIRPGQLHRGAQAWHATVRVRLLHARLRRALGQSGRWDTDAWGAPINLGDEASTLQEFCYLPLRMLRRLGLQFEPGELDGVYALWRYVGHLIGVPFALNPDGEQACGRLVELIELTRDAPDEDSIALVAGTLRSSYVGADTRIKLASASLLEGLERALAWSNLPDRHLERVHFPSSRGSRAVPVLALGIRQGEAIRRAIPNADDWLQRANRRFSDALLAELHRRAASTRGGARRPDPTEHRAARTSAPSVATWAQARQ